MFATSGKMIALQAIYAKPSLLETFLRYQCEKFGATIQKYASLHRKHVPVKSPEFAKKETLSIIFFA